MTTCPRPSTRLGVAARDLAQVDLEAPSAAVAAWLSTAAGVLFFVLVVLFAPGVAPFLSPSAQFRPVRRNHDRHANPLTILRPVGGDTVVPVDQSVNFLVYVDDRVPERAGPMR
jgi:hypothetical protein